jgi:hypothetical protein
MSERNGTRRPLGRRSLSVTVPILSGALKHALVVTRTSRPLAAKLCGRSVRTIERWITGKSPVEVHRVMTSHRLWRPFAKCLLAVDRKGGWL